MGSLPLRVWEARVQLAIATGIWSSTMRRAKILVRALAFHAVAYLVLVSLLYVFPLSAKLRFSALTPATWSTMDSFWLSWSVAVAILHVCLVALAAPENERPSSLHARSIRCCGSNSTVLTCIGCGLSSILVLVWTLGPLIYYQLNLPSYSLETRIGAFLPVWRRFIAPARFVVSGRVLSHVSPVELT